MIRNNGRDKINFNDLTLNEFRYYNNFNITRKFPIGMLMRSFSTLMLEYSVSVKKRNTLFD